MAVCITLPSDPLEELKKCEFVIPGFGRVDLNNTGEIDKLSNDAINACKVLNGLLIQVQFAVPWLSELIKILTCLTLPFQVLIDIANAGSNPAKMIEAITNSLSKLKDCLDDLAKYISFLKFVDPLLKMLKGIFTCIWLLLDCFLSLITSTKTMLEEGIIALDVEVISKKEFEFAGSVNAKFAGYEVNKHTTDAFDAVQCSFKFHAQAINNQLDFISQLKQFLGVITDLINVVPQALSAAGIDAKSVAIPDFSSLEKIQSSINGKDDIDKVITQLDKIISIVTPIRDTTKATAKALPCGISA